MLTSFLDKFGVFFLSWRGVLEGLKSSKNATPIHIPVAQRCIRSRGFQGGGTYVLVVWMGLHLLFSLYDQIFFKEIRYGMVGSGGKGRKGTASARALFGKMVFFYGIIIHVQKRHAPLARPVLPCGRGVL